MSEPITQAQDHDRRLGRLEGIAEQLDHRLDGIEKRIDGVERTIAEQGRQANARMDSIERAISELSSQTRQDIAITNTRIDRLTRWLIGI